MYIGDLGRELRGDCDEEWGENYSGEWGEDYSEECDEERGGESSGEMFENKDYFICKYYYACIPIMYFYTVNCTMYSAYFILYTVQCSSTVYIVYCKLVHVYCILYNVKFILYSLHWTIYNVHCTI